MEGDGERERLRHCEASGTVCIDVWMGGGAYHRCRGHSHLSRFRPRGRYAWIRSSIYILKPWQEGGKGGGCVHLSLYYLYEPGWTCKPRRLDHNVVVRRGELPRVYLTIEQKKNEVEENGQKSIVFVRPFCTARGGNVNPVLSRRRRSAPANEQPVPFSFLLRLSVPRMNYTVDDRPSFSAQFVTSSDRRSRSFSPVFLPGDYKKRKDPSVSLVSKNWLAR